MGEAGRGTRETKLERYQWPDDKVLISNVKEFEGMKKPSKGFKIAK